MHSGCSYHLWHLLEMFSIVLNVDGEKQSWYCIQGDSSPLSIFVLEIANIAPIPNPFCVFISIFFQGGKATKSLKKVQFSFDLLLSLFPLEKRDEKVLPVKTDIGSRISASIYDFQDTNG